MKLPVASDQFPGACGTGVTALATGNGPLATTITAMKRPLLALALLIAASASAKEILPFIENDYRTAIARARTKNIPIFVETWAPW